MCDIYEMGVPHDGCPDCPKMKSLFISSLILLLQCRNTTPLNVATGPPLLNSPVFSLAILAEDGRTNMNLVTYATPVSIRPDRVWAIGIYKETYSYDCFRKSGKGILQLLTEDHTPLVRLLGGSSGRDVHKRDECHKLGVDWISVTDNNDCGTEEHPLVLPKCASYLFLELQHQLIDGGTHDIALCRATQTLTDSDAPHLESGKLRELGIITKQGRVADA